MHGMFGSLSNLGLIARALSENYTVISVDLRNHGESPHSKEMDYSCMANDIIELMDTLNLGMATLSGHSMGGKVGMQVALNHPKRVHKLIVADIAPVEYKPDRHGGVLEGLTALTETRPTSRKSADQTVNLTFVSIWTALLPTTTTRLHWPQRGAHSSAPPYLSRVQTPHIFKINIAVKYYDSFPMFNLRS